MVLRVDSQAYDAFIRKIRLIIACKCRDLIALAISCQILSFSHRCSITYNPNLKIVFIIDDEIGLLSHIYADFVVIIATLRSLCHLFI
jgi:hypothetical protein